MPTKFKALSRILGATVAGNALLTAADAAAQRGLLAYKASDVADDSGVTSPATNVSSALSKLLAQNSKLNYLRYPAITTSIVKLTYADMSPGGTVNLPASPVKNDYVVVRRVAVNPGDPAVTINSPGTLMKGGDLTGVSTTTLVADNELMAFIAMSGSTLPIEWAQVEHGISTALPANVGRIVQSTPYTIVDADDGKTFEFTGTGAIAAGALTSVFEVAYAYNGDAVPKALTGWDSISNGGTQLAATQGADITIRRASSGATSVRGEVS